MPGRVANGEASSSKKRPRFAVGDDQDGSAVDVQEASSSLRGSGHKRARISDAGPSKVSRQRTHDGTVVSDDEETGDEVEDENPVDDLTGSPPQTQWDELRDGDFQHLEHEAEDDQRATQRLRFQPNLLGDNAVADNGILESIECINFMCHERLHVDLGPLLNFIVGQNGSGKSAVLTAITLCLGGKASSTSRGNSLKSFIKEGCDQARLIVKLKNQGLDAYKPELYGDSIIIERHFNRRGVGGYRVKSETGQIHSQKKQDVDEIAEYYVLQVDNPLNVLSQDMARAFLNTSSKADKYKHFNDGVQLQQLDNDYRIINESLEEIIAKLPDMEASVREAETKLSEAKRKVDALKGNHAIRVKHRLLRNQLVWAQVDGEERELRKHEAALAATLEKIDDLKRLLEAKDKEIADFDEKISRHRETEEVVEGEVAVVEGQVREATEAWNEMKKELEQLMVDEREAQQNLKNTEEILAETQAKIEQEEKRLEDTNGQEHNRKLQELEEAKRKVAFFIKEIDEKKAAQPVLQDQWNTAKTNLASKDKECQGKRADISHVQDKMQVLERRARSLYEGYERKVPDLVRMIENDRRYQHKPIGPLGAHVQLLKPQWSAILESQFGKSLNGFLVTSKHDMKILDEMMKQLNIRECPIFLSSTREPLDLRGKEPDESFDTILRVLKIDNDLVRDQLVINHAIEQVVLTPERKQAENILFHGSPPRNVRAIFCFRNGTSGPGLRLSENNGNMGTSVVNTSRNMTPRMRGDGDSELVFLREQHRQLEAEYKTIESEKRCLQQEVQRCEAALRMNKADKGTLEKRLRSEQVAVDNISSELDQFEGVDGRLQGLQETLRELTATRDHHGIQYGALKLKKRAQNTELEALRKQKKSENDKLEEAKARLQKIRSKILLAESNRRVALSNKSETIANIEVLEEGDLRKNRKAIETQKQTIDDFTARASELVPTRVEIPEGETSESLKKQYEVLTERIKAEEKKQGMTEGEVNKAYAAALAVRNQKVADHKTILAISMKLRKSLNIRLDKWRMFQRHITAQSRCNFQYLLAERGFRGKLLFDHRRKCLDLQVEPDKTEKRTDGRSTKTLSGGEKSFSNICLLLSIWEAMGSPLRCLDEFDVFMDNVNRAISTNMLITAARRSVNRQYIFITPNAIGASREELGKDVKIIKLGDPRQKLLV